MPGVLVSHLVLSDSLQKGVTMFTVCSRLSVSAWEMCLRSLSYWPSFCCLHTSDLFLCPSCSPGSPTVHRMDRLVSLVTACWRCLVITASITPPVSLFFNFWDMVSLLCSPGFLEVLYVDQAGPRLCDPLAFASQSLGLMTDITVSDLLPVSYPGDPSGFLKLWMCYDFSVHTPVIKFRHIKSSAIARRGGTRL